MNSVLLIGDDSFTSSVITQVRGLDALTVTAVQTSVEASQLIEKFSPDVAIVQARQLIGSSVLKTFDQERHSTYFVVIEESTLYAAEDATLAPASDNPFSNLHLERTASAIESGADAYLWLPPFQASERLPNHQPTALPAASIEASIEAIVSAQEIVAETNGQVKSNYLGVSSTLFHQSQCRLIQAHIQIGLNRAQRYRDLSRINDWLSAVALVDALTQLSNRRAFDLELPRQIKVARVKNTPLSIMVVDIDFFKSVNDRYGHLVGDDVLKMLAKRLLGNMRFYDAPFRYGGEEFVITLSNTDLQEGLAIAQRLRQSIAQLPFEISSAVEPSGQLALTVSIGLAELRPEDDDEGRSFLHRADQCLLRAKGSGRNRVVSSRN